MWAAADELRANSRLKSSEYAVPSLTRLPDGCSPEDIVYRINLVAQVLEGIRDAEAGRLMNTKVLLERVDQWAKQHGLKRQAAIWIREEHHKQLPQVF